MLSHHLYSNFACHTTLQVFLDFEVESQLVLDGRFFDENEHVAKNRPVSKITPEMRAQQQAQVDKMNAELTNGAKYTLQPEAKPEIPIELGPDDLQQSFLSQASDWASEAVIHKVHKLPPLIRFASFPTGNIAKKVPFQVVDEKKRPVDVRSTLLILDC